MVAPVDGPTTTTTTTVTPTARADAEGVDGAGAAAKDDVVFDTDDGGGEPAGVGGHGGAGGLKFVRSVARLLATNPEYRLLWLSDVVNGLGDWFNYLAVVTLVTDLSGESSLAVAGLLLTRSMPQTLLTPVVGWAADRYDRVNLMMASNLALAVVVLAYLVAGTSLPALYTVSVLQFALGALYDPAQAGVTPAVVARSDLLVANAIDTVTWSTMLALGSFAGGIALHFLGPNVCFVVDAVTYVLSTALLFLLQLRLKRQRRGGDRAGAADGEDQQALLDGDGDARAGDDDDDDVAVELGTLAGDASVDREIPSGVSPLAPAATPARRHG